VQLDPDLRALQEVRDYVGRAKRACEEVAGYSQEQIDRVCKAMADAGAAAAYDLARLAVEETGIGRVHYKILKNLLGSEGTWESIRDEKTVGIVSRDERTGITEVATPVGVVAGIIPTTNPTSTALFKALIAVKGRNAMVISPHPRARRCIGETVEVLRRAIERAGAPPDLVLSLTNPTLSSTGALMKHPKVSIILATGGTGLVEAAYSSGKPAYGVGPGNVPVYVDRSADVRTAARSIVQSQNFDNATLCCSEQALVLDRPIADPVLDEMVRCGAHVCDPDETDKLAKLCNVRGHMNPDVVGQDPWKLAELAGFSVPRHTTLLLAHQGGVGQDWPLSIEILAPLLSVHTVDGWQEGCRVSMETLHSDGLGHTCAVWASDPGVLEAWFLQKPANRIITNGPSSQGAVGYSTNLLPSMSLGCGPQAGNITSDNISAKHLVNIKRVALPRRDWDELQRRDHERAARLGGEAAPRGSLLPGDPAMGSSGPPTSTLAAGAALQSNWRGNAPLADGPAASAAPRAPREPRAPVAKVRPAPKAPGGTAAPRFTAGASATTVAPPPPKQSPPKAAPYVGGALSVGEIENIMSHAGQGCPLGPCQGCPHLSVTSGACTA
jgi:acyl-CoA reductase-like NAD-dependent aldehyde dehydrogenase